MSEPRAEKSPTKEGTPVSAGAFLEMLARRETIPNDTEVAIVGAHFDDEAIMAGAQLHKFSRSTVIHVTDSAPKDPTEWGQKGFSSKEEYGAIRKKEAKAALVAAGHTGMHAALDIRDQEALFNLVKITERLVDIFRKNNTKFVLTHAYEGGHPDHDATVFAVHTAKAILEKEGHSLSIIEAPLYRPETDGGRSVNRQSFVPMPDVQTFTYALNEEESITKKKMYEAHGTQAEVFTTMSSDTEWLRAAPGYDFTKLPNNGNLGRIFGRTGIDKGIMLELMRKASVKLGLIG